MIAQSASYKTNDLSDKQMTGGDNVKVNKFIQSDNIDKANLTMCRLIENGIRSLSIVTQCISTMLLSCSASF